MTWRAEAKCDGLPLDLFYPPMFVSERHAPERKYYLLAKLVCNLCPVKKDCLEDGMDEEFGVWGGLTPRERHFKEPEHQLTKVLSEEDLPVLTSLGSSPDVNELFERVKPLLGRRSNT
jgi:hypothetical protein